MARNWDRSCGSWRRRRGAVRSSGQTGTDHDKWCACPWRTLFATEWSAARRKPVRAAAMHIGAAISADVRPVGFRRAAAENFRPEILEARATLRSQRESAVGRRRAQPHPSPFARKTAPHASATATLQIRPVPQESRNGPLLQLGDLSQCQAVLEEVQDLD